MLRITKRSRSERAGSPERQAIVLEGRLVGPWVEELGRILGESTVGPHLTLDLCGLAFVDSDGVSLLRALRASGVQIVGSSDFVEALMGVTNDEARDVG